MQIRIHLESQEDLEFLFNYLDIDWVGLDAHNPNNWSYPDSILIVDGVFQCWTGVSSENIGMDIIKNLLTQRTRNGNP